MDKLVRKRRILSDLAKGKSRLQIEKTLREDYGVNDQTIKKDFKAAYEQLYEWQDNYVKYIKTLISERYEVLGEKAISEGDVKAAISILKQVGDLYGLNSQKADVTLKTDEAFEITFK